MGRRWGPKGGARNERVVVNVALQVGTEAPATAVQVCADPKAVVPLLNCTVPLGLAPVPVDVTIAVSATLPPPAGRLIGEAPKAVVVAVVPPPPTVRVVAPDVEVA